MPPCYMQKLRTTGLHQQMDPELPSHLGVNELLLVDNPHLKYCLAYLKALFLGTLLCLIYIDDGAILQFSPNT